MTDSTTSRPEKPRRAIYKLLAAALWLLLWQGAYRLVGEDLLLVSPLAVLRRIGELCATAAFWGSVGSSLLHILLGYLAGLTLGSLLAAGTARSRLLYEFAALPMGIVKATPVASFVILALLWLGKDSLAAFSAFLMVLPLVWSNMHEGLTRVDPTLLEMARVYRLPRLTVLRAITLPQALPYFLSAARVTLGFAWKAGVAGEVIAIPSRSIGARLYDAKIYLETPDLFAWTAVVILLSVLLEKLMVAGVGALMARVGRFAGEGGAP